MSIFKDIKLLLTFGLKNGLIGKYDKIIARNEILHLLRLDDWENEQDLEVGRKLKFKLPIIFYYITKFWYCTEVNKIFSGKLLFNSTISCVNPSELFKNSSKHNSFKFI